MDSYYAELERASKVFQLLPRKLSEDNIRMLGNLNHFETFEEDNIEIEPNYYGKRISLSGSIVVLDLDFAVPKDEREAATIPGNAGNPQQVVVNASVFLSNNTPKDAPYSPMSEINRPNEHVLASLREPRLDNFGRILAVLSKCDRFSTKDIDCFKALSLVAEVIFLRQRLRPEEAQSGWGEFGRVIVNPPNSLGLAFGYLPTLKINDNVLGTSSRQENFAFLDIMPGSRPQFSLQNYTVVSDYVNSETGEWIDQPKSALTEARAELCLTLDPPMYMSDISAQALLAELASETEEINANQTSDLDARKHCCGFSVPRHPRFASHANPADDFEVIVGNMLPFKLVKVSQVPLESPRQIPSVLALLRQFALAAALIKSVIRGDDQPTSTEAAELNIADALALRNQPVYTKRIPLAVSWRCCANEDLEIDVVWVVSDLQMTILIPRDGDLNVLVNPEGLKLHMPDIVKLLKAGRLDLALSYAVASSGRLHRRSTNKFTN